MANMQYVGLMKYTAAKHEVIGLVKTLAIELAPYNINVNAICPTAVNTGMVNNQASTTISQEVPIGTPPANT